VHEILVETVLMAKQVLEGIEFTTAKEPEQVEALANANCCTTLLEHWNFAPLAHGLPTMKMLGVAQEESE